MSSITSPPANTDLRYPVGRFEKPHSVDKAQLGQAIDEIEQLPAKLESAVAGLNDQQLDLAYRPGGWTIRQVVHHFADSHLNSYIRYRLALTADAPSIVTYDEARWAELPDARTAPIDPSLQLLRGLHRRWALLLRSMSDADFDKTFQHPERGLAVLRIDTLLYAWHCRHHLAHITNALHRLP